MPLPPLHDTIAAIATAPGTGAIGVVRVSGPAALTIARALFRPAGGDDVADLDGGRFLVGWVVDDGQPLDQGVLLVFRAPASATGQDVIELQVHGGPALLEALLAACVRRGARAAGPGEFTLRGFLAGKLDLAQAESVQALVSARSEAARRHAGIGVAGGLSRRIDAVQRQLTEAYAAVVAVLDYPEEGVEEAALEGPLQAALDELDALLATARASRAARLGAKMALVGRPNAGKSSLLNALLGFERALVSATPGTTRDYLEVPLSLGRTSLVAIDTAGLRATADEIEDAGVQRARALAQGADVVVAVVDGARPLDDEDLRLAQELAGERTLWVASKADLPGAWDRVDLGVPALLRVSAKSGSGLPALRDALESAVLGDAAATEAWLVSERQEAALREARAAVDRARTAPDDLRGLDLETALRSLAEVTGRGEVSEDTLSEVFSRFCVGK
jgi:tRNA modification GTPase